MTPLSNLRRSIQPWTAAGVIAAALAVTSSATLVPRSAHAAIVPSSFVDELVVGGLDAPTNSTLLPDGRLVFVEQYTGKVRVVVNGALSVVDPIGIVPEVRAGGEAGLIGVAVDPNLRRRPYVYVLANHNGSQTVRLWRFRLQGDVKYSHSGAMTFDVASRYTVIADFPDISPSHQAGSLRFGADGMLYVAMGDDEQYCVAQDLKSRLGKILRIDVARLPDGPGGPPSYASLTPTDNPFAANADSVARLVWAYGLRNPYMTALDKTTGWLVIGDVGNARYEEIDVACSAGRNFGWPIFEGPERTGIECAGADTTALIAPDYWYRHLTPGYSVIGGPIYRAPEGATNPFPPEYEGNVFFGDTWRGVIRRLVEDGAYAQSADPVWQLADSTQGQPDSVDWANGLRWITSMNIAPDGSLLYFLLYRTVPTSGPGELRRIRYAAPSVGVGGDDPSALGGDRAAPTLAAPWPVPSSGPLDLAYRLPRASSVSLAIFDARGRRLRTLVDGSAGVRPAGDGRARWDGRNDAGVFVPAGVYFARLDAAGHRAARRFVRLTPPTP